MRCACAILFVLTTASAAEATVYALESADGGLVVTNDATRLPAGSGGRVITYETSDRASEPPGAPSAGSVPGTAPARPAERVPAPAGPAPAAGSGRPQSPPASAQSSSPPPPTSAGSARPNPAAREGTASSEGAPASSMRGWLRNPRSLPPASEPPRVTVSIVPRSATRQLSSGSSSLGGGSMLAGGSAMRAAPGTSTGSGATLGMQGADMSAIR